MKSITAAIQIIIILFLSQMLSAKGSLTEITDINDPDVIWEGTEFRKQIKGVIGNGFLYSMDYAQDGKSLLLASSFGIELYDSKYQLDKRVFTQDLIKDAAFSPDGKSVVTLSRDALKLWDIPNKKVRRLSQVKMIPRQVLFSPKGDYIAYCGYRFAVQLIHTDTGSVETILKHKNFTTSIAFHPTEAYIVSGSQDQTVRIYSLKDRVDKVLYDAKEDVTSLIFSPKGHYLYIATKNSSLKIMDFRTRKVTNYQFKFKGIQAMAVSPDNKYMAFYTLANRFILWDIRKNTIVKRIGPANPLPSRYLNSKSLAFHPNGKKVTYINERNQVVVVDVASGKILALKEHGAYGAFSASWNGQYLLASGAPLLDMDSHLIRLKHSKTTLIKPGFKVVRSTFHPDSKRFLLAGEGKIAYYKVKTLKQEFSLKDDEFGLPYSVNIAPKSQLAAISTSENNVLFIDLKKKEITKVIDLESPAFSISFDHTGKRLAMGHSDLDIYDIERNTTKTLYSYIGGTNTLASSLTRNWIVLGDLRRLLHLVNIDTGEVRSKPKGSFGKSPVAFSYRGRYVAFGGYKSVGVWDTFKDKIREFKGYKSFVEQVAFSRDGKYVYSLGREDGLIMITKVNQ